jgi:hypothetical protein
MTRPLVISDCDEVLLHMVGPFAQWLDEAHDIEFRMVGNDFSKALRHKGSGELVEPGTIWPLLGGFFDTEMHRQTPIPGAVEAMAALAEDADVVILTNLTDRHNEARRQQLAGHGLDVRVFTNQGPKGPALRAILDEYRPSRAAFIDDIASHLGSAAEHAPEIGRLHLCGEPRLAGLIACGYEAGHAHARIDTWDAALPWLRARLISTDTGETQ